MQPKESIHGYDKIVDGVMRTLNAQEKVRVALKDGVQITDAFTLVNVYEDMRPVFNSGKALANQIKDLDTEEAKAVYAEVAHLRGADLDVVEVAVIDSLDLLSDAYDYVTYTLKRGKAISKKAEALFNKVVK